MEIYTVTVKNDASLSDGHGKVHTWMELGATGKETEYIGFTAKSEIVA